MVPLVAAAVIMVVLAVAGVGYYRAQQENAREASLQQMLAGASADLQSGRLVQPQGNNALDRYREVLRLDPGNVAAEQGVRTVAVRLVAASREATAGGRLDAAEQLLGEAVAIWPEVSNAGIAREELNAAQHRLRNRQETKDSALAEGLAALDENDTERALAAMQRAQTAGASVEDLAGLRSRLLDSLNALAAREARDARRALNRKDALAARAALQRARGFKAQAGRLARAH